MLKCRDIFHICLWSESFDELYDKLIKNEYLDAKKYIPCSKTF
jgi:hypothetical protein